MASSQNHATALVGKFCTKVLYKFGFLVFISLTWPSFHSLVFMFSLFENSTLSYISPYMLRSLTSFPNALTASVSKLGSVVAA